MQPQKFVLANRRGFHLKYTNVWLPSASKINEVVSRAWGDPESQQTHDWTLTQLTDCFYTFSWHECASTKFASATVKEHLPSWGHWCVMDFPGLYPDHWTKCWTEAVTFNWHTHTHTHWANCDAPVMNQNTQSAKLKDKQDVSVMFNISWRLENSLVTFGPTPAPLSTCSLARQRALFYFVSIHSPANECWEDADRPC